MQKCAGGGESCVAMCSNPAIGRYRRKNSQVIRRLINRRAGANRFWKYMASPFNALLGLSDETNTWIRCANDQVWIAVWSFYAVFERMRSRFSHAECFAWWLIGGSITLSETAEFRRAVFSTCMGGRRRCVGEIFSEQLGYRMVFSGRRHGPPTKSARSIGRYRSAIRNNWPPRVPSRYGEKHRAHY